MGSKWSWKREDSEKRKSSNEAMLQKHPIYCHFLDSYGVGSKLTQKKRKASTSNQDNSSDDEFDDSVLENENEKEESNEEDIADNDSDNFQDCVR